MPVTAGKGGSAGSDPGRAAGSLPVDVLGEWSSVARAADGTPICIRPLRADDRVREIAFINSLSARTRYLRLLAPLRVLPPHLLDQLMDIDYDRRMAFVATVERDGVEEFVGIARYGTNGRKDSAEVGITVTDAWQHRGIARLLMGELIRYARFRGLRCFEGLVLPENHRMLALARRLGFEVHYDHQERLMHISRDLGFPAAPHESGGTPHAA